LLCAVFWLRYLWLRLLPIPPCPVCGGTRFIKGEGGLWHGEDPATGRETSGSWAEAYCVECNSYLKRIYGSRFVPPENPPWEVDGHPVWKAQG